MQPIQGRREVGVHKEAALPEQKAGSSEIIEPTINDLPKDSGITKPEDVSKNAQKILNQTPKLPKVLRIVATAATKTGGSSVVNIKMALPEVKGETHSLDAMINVAAALFRRANL